MEGSELGGLLTAAALIVAVGDVALLEAQECAWRRAVVAGFPLLALATLAESEGHAGVDELLIAAVALALGAALFAVGQALERLLDRSPQDPA
jgi:hypothetical protein